MSRNIILLSLLLVTFVAATPPTGSDEELKLYLPDDLEATLWAESPMLFNPTNMDVDAQGRIWVTEAVNYRSYNNDSAEFLHNDQGDRVLILSDTNGDGKADKQQVFVQDKDLRSPLGIAVIGNEIYVSCAPHLIKYTDTNGDDKPDKKEIFLKGFGGYDHDHSLHSIVGGPDGKLYFNVGNAGPHTVTDKSGFTIRSGSMYTGGSPYNSENSGNRKSDDGRVWVGGLQFSVDPNGENLKVLAHNFRNSYETYIDGMGNMWQNDNDDQVVTCRVSWLPEGGNAGYFNEDGTRNWNADHRFGQDMMTAHWHQEDPGVMPYGENTGAGSPTGVLRIEGDELGEKYKGMVLSVDAGRNAIYGFQPTKSSSGYSLKGQKRTFITSNKADDPGYKWNDEKFVNDKTKWFRPSDAVIGTDGALYIADWYDAVVGGHQMKDKEGYGRIYRITPKGKSLKTPKFDLNSIEGQLRMLQNSAVNVRFSAAKMLLKNRKVSTSQLTEFLNSENPFVRLRAIWLLAKFGKEGIDEVQTLLNKGTEEEQIVAFRALRSVLGEDDFLKIIAEQKSNDSPFIRREAIISLADYSFAEKKNLLKSFAQTAPANDRYYINAVKFSLKDKADEFYTENKDWLTKNQKHFDLLYTLVPPSALPYFANLASTDKNDLEIRKKAVDAIAFINTEAAVQSMLKLAESPSEKIQFRATYWLAYRSTNAWFDLHNWKDNEAELAEQRRYNELLKLKAIALNEHIESGARQRAVKELAKSQSGGQMLIEMLKMQQLSNDLLVTAKEELISSSDETIKFQAKKLFDDNVNIFTLDEIDLAKGNELNGKKLTQTYCSSCHVIAEGGMNVGPQLTAIGNKLDRTGLYDALVNPNSSVVFGYETNNVTTNDGKSYFGFIVTDTEQALSIRDLSGKVISLSKADIKSIIKSQESIMPSVSSFGIKQSELNDIITYLSKLN